MKYGIDENIIRLRISRGRAAGVDVADLEDLLAALESGEVQEPPALLSPPRRLAKRKGEVVEVWLGTEEPSPEDFEGLHFSSDS